VSRRLGLLLVVRSDQAAVGQWRDCVVTKGAAGWLR
jgi:hypothetical protein